MNGLQFSEKIYSSPKRFIVLRKKFIVLRKDLYFSEKTELVKTEKNVLKKVLFSTTNESLLESNGVAAEWTWNVSDGRRIHHEGSPHSRGQQGRTFSSPVLSCPYFAVLSLLQISRETNIERNQERNETKGGKNKAAKLRMTTRQTKQEGKKLNDTNMGKKQRNAEEEWLEKTKIETT
jgi:hypothetical protein